MLTLGAITSKACYEHYSWGWYSNTYKCAADNECGGDVDRCRGDSCYASGTWDYSQFCIVVGYCYSIMYCGCMNGYF